MTLETKGFLPTAIGCIVVVLGAMCLELFAMIVLPSPEGWDVVPLLTKSGKEEELWMTVGFPETTREAVSSFS